MIRLLIVLSLVLNLSACASKSNPPSKKPTPKESTSTQSAKNEEYKRKIAALENKVQELEKQKAEPIEVEPPQEVSEPQEVSAPKEVSAPMKVNS